MTRGQSHLCDELNHTFVLLQTQKIIGSFFYFAACEIIMKKKNYIFIEFYCSWPGTRVCDSPGKMSSCHFNTVWSFTNAAAFNNNLLLKLRSIFYLQSTVLTSENKILVVKNNQNFKDYFTFYHRPGFLQVTQYQSCHVFNMYSSTWLCCCCVFKFWYLTLADCHGSFINNEEKCRRESVCFLQTPLIFGRRTHWDASGPLTAPGSDQSILSLWHWSRREWQHGCCPGTSHRSDWFRRSQGSSRNWCRNAVFPQQHVGFFCFCSFSQILIQEHKYSKV